MTIRPTYLYKFSTSCTVAGKGLFIVSGRKQQSTPPMLDKIPMTRRERPTHISSKRRSIGTEMPPIRETMLNRPKPRLLYDGEEVTKA